MKYKKYQDKMKGVIESMKADFSKQLAEKDKEIERLKKGQCDCIPDLTIPDEVPTTLG
jgi:hypothetical protein